MADLNVDHGGDTDTWQSTPTVVAHSGAYLTLLILSVSCEATGPRPHSNFSYSVPEPE